MNTQRNEWLQSISWALGTLRCATSNINIAEEHPECDQVVMQQKEIALRQIERIRDNLTMLEKSFE